MSKAITDKASRFQRNNNFTYKDVHAKYGDHFQCASTEKVIDIEDAETTQTHEEVPTSSED